RDFAVECSPLANLLPYATLFRADLAADVDGDLLGEVALLDRGGDLGDVADLAGQVAGHEVDVFGQVFPDAGDALDVGLAAELALGAHLTRHARDLAREGVELVDHGVDGMLALEDLAALSLRDVLPIFALLDRGGDLGDVADLAGQVACHQVHVVGEVFPDAGYAAHLGLAAELAVGADLARDARHLARERVELTDHRVDGLGRGEELPLQRPALDLEGHGLQQVTVGHRADDAHDLCVRTRKVFDQVVDRVEGRGPRAARMTARRVLDLPLLADAAAKAADLALEALVRFDDGVERRSDFARGARRSGGHARGKVAALHRRQDAQHRRAVDPVRAIHAL